MSFVGLGKSPNEHNALPMSPMAQGQVTLYFVDAHFLKPDGSSPLINTVAGPIQLPKLGRSLTVNPLVAKDIESRLVRYDKQTRSYVCGVSRNPSLAKESGFVEYAGKAPSRAKKSTVRTKTNESEVE